MDASTEQGLELASLVLTDPTAFANKFAWLLSGYQPHGDMSASPAGIFDEMVHHRNGAFEGDIVVKLEESHGGGEGEGETVSRVYSVSRRLGKDQVLAYIKATGCYYSHDGTYWDDSFTRVYPQRYIAVRFTDTQLEDEC